MYSNLYRINHGVIQCNCWTMQNFPASSQFIQLRECINAERRSGGSGGVAIDVLRTSEWVFLRYQSGIQTDKFVVRGQISSSYPFEVNIFAWVFCDCDLIG